MTSARTVAARALDGIDGWSGAELTALPGGRTNTTWLVEKHGRRAILKADAAVREFPFASREAEAGVQRAAAANGLASDVIYASPTVLLTDYLVGDPLTPEKLVDETLRERLAAVLHRVHRLPRTGREFDAGRAARLYASRIAVSNAREPSAVREQLHILESLPAPDELCCCHNDVVAGNILATPRLKLLDWEYASDNDPMFDLAVVAVHHELDDARTGELLDAYPGNVSEKMRARLATELTRYRALAWLWEAATS